MNARQRLWGCILIIGLCPASVWACPMCNTHNYRNGSSHER